jgi:cytochrome P450
VVDFNPFDVQDMADPYPAYAELRQQCPVLGVGPGSYYVTRHDTCSHVLFDRDTFSSRGGLTRRPPEEDVVDEVTTVNATDEPLHTRLRKLLRSALATRLVAANEEFVSDASHKFIDEFIDKGEANLVKDLAAKLPARVILKMIGVPDSDYAKVRGWTEDLEHSVDSANGQSFSDFYTGKAQHPAADAFFGYVRELIHERRAQANPPDDLVSRMVTFRDDDGQAFSDQSMIIQLTFLLIAGNETTSDLISNLMLTLAGDPALFQRLRADRSLVPAAVEESLRHDSPVTMIMRTAREDTEIDGTVVPVGSRIFTALGAANRDESAYPRADEFDLDRDRTTSHVAFGIGPHLCIGAPLARMEAKHAVNAILDRIESMELAPDFVYERVDYFAFQAPKRLPVKFTAAPRS